MYIETKTKRLYEPLNPANLGLWEWLKDYIVLDGSDAYNEIARIYEMQEYDYQRRMEDYNHERGMVEAV